jgi:hypothetical protein
LDQIDWNGGQIADISIERRGIYFRETHCLDLPGNGVATLAGRAGLRCDAPHEEKERDKNKRER